MLYKNISSIKGRYFDFIKYDKKYQNQLLKLSKLNLKFAKAVESYPRIFNELSERQSYLLLQDLYSLIGAVVIGTSTDEQILEVNLFFVPEVINFSYFQEMLSEIIQSLENYFYDKKAIEIQFVNPIDEDFLQKELGFTEWFYENNCRIFYRENQFHKTIPLLLEEINKAEQCLLNWKQFWWVHYGIEGNSKQEIDAELLKEYNNHEVQYNGKLFYKSEQIQWQGIKSKKSDRTILFERTGDIKFEKNSFNNLPTYEASCNVNSQDFIISAKYPYINGYDFLGKPQNSNHYYNLTRNGNFYIVSMDKIEIIYDIEKGTKTIRIMQPKEQYGDASITFEAKINEAGKFNKGYIQITTHKGNGKINGTYRINVNPEGVQANYYSRKGKKYELNNNPLLTGNILRLSAPKGESASLSEHITATFVEESTNVLCKPEH